MSLKYKPCCSQQGYQEFNFSQMVFSSSLQPASVRREQDAHSVPGCALHRAHPEHEPAGPIKGAHVPSYKTPRVETCRVQLIPLCSLWEQSSLPPAPNPSSSLQNLEATTPVDTFYPMPQPCVSPCQSQLHLPPGGWIKQRGKEESGRTSELIRNVWGGKKRGGKEGERWR